MPRQLIKRLTPDHDRIRKHRHLQFFGRLLHDANLWHLNRRSASGAFAIGLFVAFLPFPFQMVVAAAGAILFRVNLPISVALVWITNPLTIPPMFYFSYLVGTWVLGTPPTSPHPGDFSVDSLVHGLEDIWQPLLLGSLICGTLAGSLGYAVILGLWRWRVIRHLRRRRRANPAGNRRLRVPKVSQSEQSTPS